MGPYAKKSQKFLLHFLAILSPHVHMAFDLKSSPGPRDLASLLVFILISLWDHCPTLFDIRHVIVIFAFWLLKFFQARENKGDLFRALSCWGTSRVPIGPFNLPICCIRTFVLTPSMTHLFTPIKNLLLRLKFTQHTIKVYSSVAFCLFTIL